MVETRKLAAILIADVAGYSLLTGADEEGTLARLRSLRSDLINPTIGIHNGRVVKRTGDGAIVEFRSVVEAVRCAIDVQRGLAERNVGVPDDKRIEARVGIHLGDVVEESDGDLMGDGVNIAARLQGIAAPGTICLSEQAYWQVKGRLDLAVTDLGPTQLKNIAEPVRVYSLQVGVPAQPKPAEPKPPEPEKPSRLALLSAGLLALIVIAAGAWYFLAANRHATDAAPQKTTLVQGPTVAVLPFDNLTGDAAQNSFADGLSEELISDLSRFKELRVLARNTTFTFKGKSVDVPELGRKLDAQYVIEGSVRHVADHIGVTAQLVETLRGNHVWSENYGRDSTSTNLLSIQDEVAGKISASLGDWDGAIAAAELQRSRSKAVTELNAYECMVQADEASNLRESSAASRRARTCLEDLVRREPANAEAWAWLSRVLSVQRQFGAGLDPPESDDLDKRAYLVDRVTAAADAAVELAPADPFARWALANAYWAACQRDQLRVEAERAIALNPNDAFVFGTIGNWLGFTGLWEIGAPLAEKGIAMSAPNTPRWWWYVVFKDHWFHGRYEQALDSLQKSYAEQSWLSQLHMAYVLPALGRIDEAKAHVATLLKMKPGFTIREANAYYTTWCFEPAFREKMMSALRLAGLPE